jgi:hypothetical protein
MTRRCRPCVRARRGQPGERGAGLLGAALGVAVVMGALGLCVNVALGLWTRSTVDSVAYDAVVDVASSPAAASAESTSPGLAAAEAAAIDRARATLGAFGAQVDMSFEHPDPAVLVLRVRAPGVSLLPRFLGSGPIVGAVDRRLVVRREGQT